MKQFTVVKVIGKNLNRFCQWVVRKWAGDGERIEKGGFRIYMKL